MHLLKWKYQPLEQSNSWLRKIKEQRLQIKMIIIDNPSLKSILEEYIIAAYRICT